MYALSRRVRLLLHALDGFVLAAVGSLVLLHIMPRALALGGFWSIAAGAIGLAVPALLEPLIFSRRAQTGHGPKGWAIAIGLLGLLSHTLIDGAAIGSERHPGALSWAIVLHRLPAGILVWWLVRPAFGLKRAWLMLSALILATIGGFLLGQRFDVLEERSLAVFEAFVAGALLHVLLSHGPELHGEHVPHNRVAELLGGALGVLMVALVPEASGHAHAQSLAGATTTDLLRLSYVIALPMIVGFALAGVVATLRSSADRRGLLAALLRPVGAGRAARELAATGDLLALAATPLLSLPAILVSLVLLGSVFTVLRFGLAVVASLAVTAIVGRAAPASVDPPPSVEPATTALRLGFVQLMDESAAWILFGAAVAVLAGDAKLAIPALVSVPAAALLALVPFVCATGATPLAAALIAAGLSPGSALAFLITGPMVHATSLAAIRERFGRPSAVRFALAALGTATLLGIIVDLALPALRPSALSFDLGGSVDRAAAICLLTLIAAALVRLGPRGFVQHMFRPSVSEHEHHHD